MRSCVEKIRRDVEGKTMTKTKIGWVDRVWNPITGCTKISEACPNCYAEKMTSRLQAMGLEKYKTGFDRVVCHPWTGLSVASGQKINHKKQRKEMKYLWKIV